MTLVHAATPWGVYFSTDNGRTWVSTKQRQRSHMAELWKRYTLTMKVDDLVGGIPRHPEIVKRWQEANWPAPTKLQADDPQSSEEAAALTVEALGASAFDPDEKVAGIWTGFCERDGQLVIENRQVKAMLKESANIVKTFIKSEKGKTVPLMSKVAERVFVHPKWITLGRAGPDATKERPIHVMTAQGPRTALKRTDHVEDVTITCELRVLDDGLITESVLRLILDHACENGLGTDRSQGAGTFEYLLESE